MWGKLETREYLWKMRYEVEFERGKNVEGEYLGRI